MRRGSPGDTDGRFQSTGVRGSEDCSGAWCPYDPAPHRDAQLAGRDGTRPSLESRTETPGTQRTPGHRSTAPVQSGSAGENRTVAAARQTDHRSRGNGAARRTRCPTGLLGRRARPQGRASGTRAAAHRPSRRPGSRPGAPRAGVVILRHLPGDFPARRPGASTAVVRGDPLGRYVSALYVHVLQLRAPITTWCRTARSHVVGRLRPRGVRGLRARVATGGRES